MSISNYAELKLLDALCNATSFSVANVYVKLHLGDPGEDCTSNPAVNTSRQQVTFAAASSGSCLSDNLVQWVSVSTTETYTHISLWDASSAGNALGSGALAVPQAMTAGNTFDLPIGDVTFSID